MLDVYSRDAEGWLHDRGGPGHGDTICADRLASLLAAKSAECETRALANTVHAMLAAGEACADSVLELRAKVALYAEWIQQYSQRTEHWAWRDHACAECGGSMVVPDFRCTVHAALSESTKETT